MNVISIVETASVGMFFIGFFGLIISRNIIKSLIFITMMEAGVVMFFLSIGAAAGILPPIAAHLYGDGNLADPLPSALMITAIVIGLSVMAITLTMLMTLLRRYRTADWTAVQEAIWQENLENFGEDEAC